LNCKPSTLGRGERKALSEALPHSIDEKKKAGEGPRRISKGRVPRDEGPKEENRSTSILLERGMQPRGGKPGTG